MKEYRITDVSIATPETDNNRIVVMRMKALDTQEEIAIMFQENNDLAVEISNGVITLQTLAFPVVEKNKEVQVI